MASQSNPLFVLVPGILHMPTHFKLLILALKSKGFDSIAVSLPNIGPGAATAQPGDDSKAVRSMVERCVVRDEQDVVLFAIRVAAWRAVKPSTALRRVPERGRVREVESKELCFSTPSS